MKDSQGQSLSADRYFQVAIHDADRKCAEWYSRQLPEWFTGCQFVPHAMQRAGNHSIAYAPTAKRRISMRTEIAYCKVLSPRPTEEDVGAVDVHALAAVLGEFGDQNGSCVLVCHKGLVGWLIAGRVLLCLRDKGLTVPGYHSLGCCCGELCLLGRSLAR